MDEPDHREHRALLHPVLSRQAVEREAASAVGRIVDDAISAIAPAGSSELITDLLLPLPARILGHLLGLDPEEVDRFHLLSIEINGPTVDRTRAEAASEALADWLQPVIAARRSRPGSDLISVLAASSLHGRPVTPEQVFAFVRLLGPAGTDTVYRSSSNLVLGLLSQPDQMEALRRDRSLMPQAIDEAVRWECPLVTVLRGATEDIPVGAVTIPAGSVIAVHVGAANHDPARWTDPEDFDIFRPRLANVGFGGGPHGCVGIHLARVTLTCLLESLVRHLPALRLDPRRTVPQIEGQTFRAPARLDVVWR